MIGGRKRRRDKKIKYLDRIELMTRPVTNKAVGQKEVRQGGVG